MTARRCWTCHAAYTLEEFRELPAPERGERMENPNGPDLILRQCACGNTLVLPEPEVYPPDTGADVVSLDAVRTQRRRAASTRINVGTSDAGNVWLASDGAQAQGFDMIDGRLGWWLTPDDADALAEMLRGAAAKARGTTRVPFRSGGPGRILVPGPDGRPVSLVGQGRMFTFKDGPIKLSDAEGKAVRFNYETGECELVDPEPDPEPESEET